MCNRRFNRSDKFLYAFLGLVLGVAGLRAGCVEESSPASLVAQAQGIFRGTVLGASSGIGSDGRVWTHWRVRVDHALKGSFPEAVRLSAPIGSANGRANWESTYQWIGPWDDALFLVREQGGLLSLTQGLGVFPDKAVGDQAHDASLRQAILAAIGPETGRGGNFSAFATSTERGVRPLDVTASGYIEDGFGVPARLMWGDRGTPVPVLVDKDFLPPGMSEATALAALQSALDAWAEASSLRFKIEGYASFGMASPHVDADDAKLRIQLHDAYGYISNAGTTLGIGGRGHTILAGAGGTVKGLEFNPTTSAYVVLDHDKSSMQNALTFEEVLTHEIGHALGLAHTSESSGESNPLKRQAIMYFQAHSDGRGASLNALDVETIHKAYPVDDTPPFGLGREVTQVSSSGDINAIGTNDFLIVGGDLQGSALTLELIDKFEGVGTIALVGGNTLRFTPGGNFGDADAGGSSFYARATLRFSDGTNLSPTFEFRVRKLRHDGNGDGLPDSWVADSFAGKPPGNRGPFDDFDGDRINNLREFRWGLDPTTPDILFDGGASDGRSIAFEGLAGVPYSFVVSDDFETWSVINLFAGAGAMTLDFLDAPASGGHFYAVQAVE